MIAPGEKTVGEPTVMLVLIVYVPGGIVTAPGRLPAVANAAELSEVPDGSAPYRRTSPGTYAKFVGVTPAAISAAVRA
jgi:hypothetical protein